MPKITVDGRVVECKDRQMILQACLDGGQPLPHYCYHPGLSIPASCRICLVEVEGIPKLVPSCQTPVRDGMVVHSQSSKAIANQKQVMEYLLVNHPLDCPVCDQAGECYLQDYSYEYGRAESRFEEDKAKKPKKDVGLNVLLYNDRCIMCTRCVRFTREVSGTSELYVDGRGHREEIDVFPGKPLDNKLSGNVVDLCPVGALLDKEFLFKQRVWLLKSAPSISPADSGGENIWLDHNEGKIWRSKPRYNAEVNGWWISDDTRYSWKFVHDPKRLVKARRTQYGTQVETAFAKALEEATAGLKGVVVANNAGSLYAMLSPMMACEEAWLLGKAIREMDPEAVLVLGPVPVAGKDEVFHHYLSKKETFRIKAEKVPNAAGIRRVMALLGGPQATFAEMMENKKPEVMKLKGGWIVGGYGSNWIPKDLPAAMKKGFRVVQDVLPNSLADSADVVLPAAAFAEKDGCWENHAGKIQAFLAAVKPVEGARREGDVYYALLGRKGLYHAAEVRAEMGSPFADVKTPSDKIETAAPEFVELQLKRAMAMSLVMLAACMAHAQTLPTTQPGVQSTPAPALIAYSLAMSQGDVDGVKNSYVAESDEAKAIVEAYVRLTGAIGSLRKAATEKYGSEGFENIGLGKLFAADLQRLEETKIKITRGIATAYTTRIEHPDVILVRAKDGWKISADRSFSLPRKKVARVNGQAGAYEELAKEINDGKYRLATDARLAGREKVLRAMKKAEEQFPTTQPAATRPAA